MILNASLLKRMSLSIPESYSNTFFESHRFLQQILHSKKQNILYMQIIQYKIKVIPVQHSASLLDL